MIARSARDAEDRQEPAPARIRELDALRGFAVCGITLVNAWQHTSDAVRRSTTTPTDWLVENLLQSRFFPIFSFLFGVSFVLFLRSAARRTAHPRLVLLRRLAALAALGLLHRTLSPGEVLLPYALTGAIVLLPASYLRRWMVLAAGVAAVTWAVLVHAGGVWLIPGLFLLGMAVIAYAPGRRALTAAFLISAPLAVALAAAWAYLWVHPETFRFPYTVSVYPLAGLAGATAYCTGLLLALPHLPWLSAVLEPLGRIALTAYVTGTLITLAVLPLLTRDDTRAGVLVVAALAIAALTGFARWWTARFRYGPLEWAWRCATWYHLIPNRRPPAGDTHA
ncbi:hypothetical protein Sme01_09130 [Sphaerisporangium melleum]|uniref:DUF418 domain-containing protein n=1 Tax=Sphaerisporangium melleum TaxID=321316 RepID=A0A917QU34_9ACTN|nr:DUF418 domain-containing protein [Sphaerisporangium melleum]GGK67763.1 hypothetical protein GCM10007964_08480 [Sphaerisporangium melleum]GII68437.1 hypothetical protein Sme01_09130 [Sphaerisporangium melleum]